MECCATDSRHAVGTCRVASKTVTNLGMSADGISGYMAAAWHGAANGDAIGFPHAIPHFWRGTKKEPVKGLKVSRVSLRRQARPSQYRGVRIEDQYAHVRHGGQVHHDSAARRGTHASSIVVQRLHSGLRRFRIFGVGQG